MASPWQNSYWYVCVTSPDASWVSVSQPKRAPPHPFSLPHDGVSYLVAFPTQIGSTPSASGSSVPVWPIFRVLRIPLKIATTSWEVYPFSLYTLIMPSI